MADRKPKTIKRVVRRVQATKAKPTSKPKARSGTGDRAYALPYCMKDGVVYVLVKVVKEVKKASDGKHHYTYSLLGGKANPGQEPEGTASRQVMEESINALNLTREPQRRNLKLIYEKGNKKGGKNRYFKYDHGGCEDKKQLVLEHKYLQQKFTEYMAQQRAMWGDNFEHDEEQPLTSQQKTHGGNCMEASFIIWVPLTYLSGLGSPVLRDFRDTGYPHKISDNANSEYLFFKQNKDNSIVTEYLWGPDRAAIIALRRDLGV